MKSSLVLILLLGFVEIGISQSGYSAQDEKQTWQQRQEDRNLQREDDERSRRERNIEKKRQKKEQQDMWEEGLDERIKESLEKK